MIPRNVIDQIKKQAVKADWQVAFGGKAKGNRHLSRVVTIAKFLAEKEDARPDVCEAGAWLHDIGLVDGNDDNPAKIRAYAESLLTDLPLDSQTRARIADCAETHEGTEEAVCREARVVHDADALDKMGMLGVIRHSWKIVNLIKPNSNPDEVFLILREHLAERERKLYTITAKRLVRVLNEPLQPFFANQARAVELLAMIIDSAKTGIVADEIANMPFLKEFRSTLMQQANVTDTILQEWLDQEKLVVRSSRISSDLLPTVREVVGVGGSVN